MKLLPTIMLAAALLLPAATFAQEGTELDFTTPEIARTLELVAKYDAGSITEAELRELAVLNSGDPALAQYRDEEPKSEIVDEEPGQAEVERAPSIPEGITEMPDGSVYIPLNQADEQLQARVGALFTSVYILAGALFINVLLTIYLLIRKPRSWNPHV